MTIINSSLPLILLTNDDGVQSPGLWAAAEALVHLGEIVIAAPREQATGAGRSLPSTSDGRIERIYLPINGRDHPAYAVGGTPAQSVLHAVLEILPRRPDLVVSGINYGENVGSGVTISGTVGAALEAAALGIPALAVSLQLLNEQYYDYQDLDFSTAAAFTTKFAKAVLMEPLPADVDLLKIEIPAHANPETPWRMTCQARHRYYIPYPIRQGEMNEPGMIAATIRVQADEVPPDSDVKALHFDHFISVTPLSIDLTSRVDLQTLAKRFLITS